jgi:hypothetical protein
MFSVRYELNLYIYGVTLRSGDAPRQHYLTLARTQLYLQTTS